MVTVVAFASIIQKLEKVQRGLREEQKICDGLKGRHAVAVAEQRHCHSLLKAFQVLATNMMLS